MRIGVALKVPSKERRSIFLPIVPSMLLLAISVYQRHDPGQLHYSYTSCILIVNYHSKLSK